MHTATLKSLLRAILLGSGSLLSVLSVPAQDTATLTARLLEAAADSSLDSPGATPWHLKLDVKLFSSAGVPTEQGTIEEWWANPKAWRVTYSTPTFTGSELHVDDKVYRTTSPNLEPALFADLLDQVVHPFQYEGDLGGVEPELRKERFGKVDLDCIMLDHPLKNVVSPPLGLFPTFCLAPGKLSLRVSIVAGGLVFLRNQVSVFHGHSVPLDLSVQDGLTNIATAHISSLSTVTADSLDLKPSADMTPVGSGVVKISSGFMAKLILTQTELIRPERARKNQVSGAVLLRAIIGRNGRIRLLRVIFAPDSDLAIASLQAVRHWVYKPYLVDGLPTSVDTTITASFSSGSR